MWDFGRREGVAFNQSVVSVTVGLCRPTCRLCDLVYGEKGRLSPCCQRMTADSVDRILASARQRSQGVLIVIVVLTTTFDARLASRIRVPGWGVIARKTGRPASPLPTAAVSLVRYSS